MKVQTTNSVTEQKIKALVGGFSGAGKTTLAKTLKKYRPLIISAESGLLSLAGTGIDFIDISKDDAGNIIPKEQRIDRLTEVYRYSMTEECKKKYGVLFIDSLTEISQCLFDRLRKDFPERKDNLVLYGELSQKTREVVKAFRDTGDYHVVFSCLSVVDKDETGKRFPAFDVIGGISSKLPGFFDLVLYLRALPDGKRELVCNSTDTIIAKNRGDKLQPIEAPDLGLIFDKILQQPTEEKGNK
jgi:adenylate kinase family enzyme